MLKMAREQAPNNAKATHNTTQSITTITAITTNIEQPKKENFGLAEDV